MSRNAPIDRHPLCTCPELTWDHLTGRAAAPDLDACRASAPFGIDPHPVLDPRHEDVGDVLAWLRRARGQ